jgi:hypothetical protein
MSLTLWILAVIIAALSAHALPWINYLGVFVALTIAGISGATK